MRNWGLPERGKTACLMNKLSQATALPSQRSASQPEVDRHNNEGTTMQGLPLEPSQSNALSYHSDVHHYSGKTLSLRPTNVFYRERKGFIFQTAGSTHMQCSINSTNMMDNFGFMGNSSQSGMVLDGDDTRASLIRNGGRLFESNVKCQTAKQSVFFSLQSSEMWALRHARAHSVSTISAFISSKAAMSRNKFESKECYATSL